MPKEVSEKFEKLNGCEETNVISMAINNHCHIPQNSDVWKEQSICYRSSSDEPAEIGSFPPSPKPRRNTLMILEK
ncbi:hypothetical protein CEXT_701041 [Caerostris extrusa]|uniref:Uncharacterized protein n=1 Tax=Caerostris extrusa TaxID=172846 RepID=A0AAV4SI02_CAEEX|nr:hypothetical protein CEXT_701041 [Caerostris extrusa]